MNRGRHQDSLSHNGGKLENGVGYMPSRLLVQKTVVALAGRDMDLLSAHHVVEYIRIHAGGIYDHIRPKHTVRCFQDISAVLPPYRADLCVEEEVHPIVTGILRQGNGQPKGTHNPACGRVQGIRHRVRQIGLHLPCLVPADYFEIRHPIGAPFLIERFQGRAVRRVKGENQGSVPPKFKIQLPGKFLHHPVALHIKPGLQGARSRVKSRVDNGAVGFGCAGANILLPLCYADPQVPAGKLPGHSAARNPCANNHHIIP